MELTTKSQHQVPHSNEGLSNLLYLDLLGSHSLGSGNSPEGLQGWADGQPSTLPLQVSTEVSHYNMKSSIPPWSTSKCTYRDLTKIEDLIHRLFNFAWVNIPLVYTQLVQIAVDMYFFCTLFGFQVNFVFFN